MLYLDIDSCDDVLFKYYMGGVKKMFRCFLSGLYFHLQKIPINWPVLNLCEVVIITIYCISAFQDKYTIKLEPIPLDVGIKEKFPGGVSHSDVILVRVDMKVKPLLLDTKPGGLWKVISLFLPSPPALTTHSPRWSKTCIRNSTLLQLLLKVFEI